MMEILRLNKKVNDNFDLLFFCCFCTAEWTAMKDEAVLAYTVFNRDIYTMKCPCCGEWSGTIY